MSLCWPEERYVRLYTRDTIEWDMMPWQSRALFPLLIRKVDRAGLLELGKYGARGLASKVGLPVEVVEPGLAGLIEDGCVAKTGTTIVVPNFIEAQEATATDAARAKAYRERKRAEALDAPSRNVTQTSRTVTDRHDANESSLLAVPNHAVPNQPISSAPPDEEFDFEVGYALHLNKEGKKKGMQRCRSQITSRSKYDAWMRAVRNYAAKMRSEGREVKHTKQWDTFMNAWEDYVNPGGSLKQPAVESHKQPDFFTGHGFKVEE